MDTYIILVAGGKGLRMESGQPKQFMLLGEKPVVMHTFEAFSMFYGKAKFLLVLPGIEIGQWKHLCVQYGFDVEHQIVEGGPTRYHSVKNALLSVPNRSLVCIHDAVRPLVSAKTIQACFRTAAIHGNAIPVVNISQSLRQVENGMSKAVDREKFRLVQTPQVFQSELLKKAYMQVYQERFIDDAAVVESSGELIHVVTGNRENIKITWPEDLAYAAYLMGVKEK
jgi:2-C-methyl-D-erythritol 4-phosphate cytidylyltransferase